ncbi:MAG: hypothetical protein B7O98_07620 [Zestosphaera tikiterensis]|uniref:DUF58 domain-containing protein n=1 Tax=Zestosphaera tikiterensis TaxID=1973259 RepID=A0A2R7Y4P0_9CREN|nr:MAG: hypothetical protein B7O98_07620 [Zestosphaera tikiterensis]
MNAVKVKEVCGVNAYVTNLDGLYALIVTTVVILAVAVGYASITSYTLVSTVLASLITGYVVTLASVVNRITQVEVVKDASLTVGRDEVLITEVMIRHTVVRFLKFYGVQIVTDNGLKIVDYSLTRRSGDEEVVVSIKLKSFVGRHRLGPLTLKYSLGGGLVRGEFLVNTYVDITTLPSIKTLRTSLSVRGLQSIGAMPSRGRGVGTQFFEVREYVPGDDFKRIEWKTTARLSKLAVKELEHESLRGVVMVLALDDDYFMREVNAYDHIAREVTNVVENFLRNNLYVKVLVVTERGYTVSEKLTSLNHISKLLKALADVEWPIELSATSSALRVSTWLITSIVKTSCKDRCLVVYLCNVKSDVDVISLNKVYRELKALGHDVMFIIAPPALMKILKEPAGKTDLALAKYELRHAISLSRKIPKTVLTSNISAEILKRILSIYT